MSLYDIAKNLNDFMDAVDRGEIPEEAVYDTLESLDMQLDDKIDNVACMIKNLAAEAKSIKEEADNLTARAKAKANKAEWLKGYLATQMQLSNKEKFESKRNKLTFRKSESVEVNEEAFIKWAAHGHDELLTYKPPVPNKTAIKELLKSGGTAEGAEIVVKQNLQIK